ncbi:MAG: TlpA family protein disulfide reductase [Gammaproteobacteria bacterium]|nr:TlpA family protein disulfide reductase [Gammaproteobacteria bacterium]
MKDAKDNPQDTRSRRYRSLLLNGAALLAVFIVVTTYQSRNMLATGDEVAPELRGTTLEGEPYDLEDAGSRPALVYFFAPWCKICAASADNLNRLRRWRNESELEMVAVALDWSEAEEVRAYVQRHELDITVVLGDSNVARQWQIYAFPSYYVLDSEHRIARRDIGYSSQLGLLWRAWTVDWH